MRVAFALLGVVVAGCQQANDKAAAAPADCARVAETLASFELGTAVTPAQRAPVVAKHRAACESTRVTKAEAACLSRATDTWAARACLPRMFAPPSQTGAAAGCATVVARMRSAVLGEIGSDGPAGRAALDKLLPVIQTACEEDGWPAAVLDCIGRAKPGDMAAFQACSNQLPKPQQDKLSQRLTAQQQAQPPAAEPPAAKSPTPPATK